VTASPEQLQAHVPAHLFSPAHLAAHLTRGDVEPYLLPPHLELVSDALVRATLGDPEYARIMVLMPPRHGKSELCSKWFPTWLFGLLPHLSVILASHGFEFASTWGRKVRDTVAGHWPELGVRIVEDSRARHEWRIRPPDGSGEGGMSCVGVGTSVTGRGADVLILDDPTKDAEDAASAVIQDRNWDWWLATYSTRLNPLGRRIMVVIGTRWDEHDLIGRLLQAHADGPGATGYEPWHVIDLPSIADGRPDPLGREIGEPLWFGLDYYGTEQRKLGPYWWAALHQQRPTAKGGNLLKERWWNYWVPRGTLDEYGPVQVDGRDCKVVELPESQSLFEFQSWDTNFHDWVREMKSGREPDPVAGHVWARSLAPKSEGDLYLLDREWGRFDLEATIQAVRDLSARRPAARVRIIEYTANGPAVMARLIHEMGGWVPATPRGSKAQRVLGNPTEGSSEALRGARAVGLQAFCQGGNAYLPHPRLFPWVTDLRRLLGAFPKDGRDDTDAASQAWGWAQNPMWRASADRAAREAQQEEMPKTTQELFRRQIREMIERGNVENRPEPGPTPYDRIRS
jgi:predicted phage terminase large subunit-like protein